MSFRRERIIARRQAQAVQRLEQQVYNYVPTRRTPRTAASVGTFWCQLGSSIGAATGGWPCTPATLSGQTVYSSADGSLISLGGGWTIVNIWPVSFAANLTTCLRQVGPSKMEIIDQVCSSS